MTTQSLAAELASRIPEMARDNSVNNSEVIRKMLDDFYKEQIFALNYVDRAIGPAVITGRLSEGGEQIGNWIHLVEAQKIIQKLIK